MNHTYIELQGRDFSGEQLYVGYLPCRHTAEEIPHIPPAGKCREQNCSGELIPDQLFIKVQCSCRSYLYYSNTKCPKAGEIRHVGGKHKPKPFTIEG